MEAHDREPSPAPEIPSFINEMQCRLDQLKNNFTQNLSFKQEYRQRRKSINDRLELKKRNDTDWTQHKELGQLYQESDSLETEYIQAKLSHEQRTVHEIQQLCRNFIQIAQLELNENDDEESHVHTDTSSPSPPLESDRLSLSASADGSEQPAEMDSQNEYVMLPTRSIQSADGLQSTDVSQQTGEQQMVPSAPASRTALSLNKKREFSETPMQFDDVYQNGKASSKHSITEWPKGADKWYILRCQEHGIPFNSKNPIMGARAHVIKKHKNIGRTSAALVALFGEEVQCCNAQLAKQNNALSQHAGCLEYSSSPDNAVFEDTIEMRNLSDQEDSDEESVIIEEIQVASDQKPEQLSDPGNLELGETLETMELQEKEPYLRESRVSPLVLETDEGILSNRTTFCEQQQSESPKRKRQPSPIPGSEYEESTDSDTDAPISRVQAKRQDIPQPSLKRRQQHAKPPLQQAQCVPEVKPGNVYAVYLGKWLATLMLPLANLKKIGIHQSFERIGLTDDMPLDYKYNEETDTILETETVTAALHGPNKQTQKHPVYVFSLSDKEAVKAGAWMSMEDLFPYADYEKIMDEDSKWLAGLYLQERQSISAEKSGIRRIMTGDVRFSDFVHTTEDEKGLQATDNTHDRVVEDGTTESVITRGHNKISPAPNNQDSSLSTSDEPKAFEHALVEEAAEINAASPITNDQSTLAMEVPFAATSDPTLLILPSRPMRWSVNQL